MNGSKNNDRSVEYSVSGRHEHDPTVEQLDDERALKLAVKEVALEDVDGLQLEAEHDLVLDDELEDDEPVEPVGLVETESRFESDF